MPAVARFLYITIDAQDAERIADFWAAVLDTEREEELDNGRFLVLKGRDDLPALCVQRVPEPKRGKVRIHLDLGAPDLAEATTRIQALGARGTGGPDPRRRRVADVRRSGGARVRHPSRQVVVGRSSVPASLARSWNWRMKAASASTPRAASRCRWRRGSRRRCGDL